MPSKKSFAAPNTPAELWQAGLGALTKAQAEATSKLESIFEERVAKALNALGVPSAQEVLELRARVDELTAAVQKLSGPPTAAPKRRTSRTPK